MDSIAGTSVRDTQSIDRDFRKRAQSVLAVDTMIGELEAAVAAIGQEKNTYVVFRNILDNGYHMGDVPLDAHMGEYRLMPGKMTAYDTDVHVPLVVMGPGVPAGQTVDAIAENVDLCPTFLQLAGADRLPNMDGASLAGLMHGGSADGWRTVTLVEHHGPVRDLVDPDMPIARSGNPTTYEAIRSQTDLYVEYADGGKEYHDLRSDPDELHNTYSSLPGVQKTALHTMLMNTVNCHSSQECWTAQGGTWKRDPTAPGASSGRYQAGAGGGFDGGYQGAVEFGDEGGVVVDDLLPALGVADGEYWAWRELSAGADRQRDRCFESHAENAVHGEDGVAPGANVHVELDGEVGSRAASQGEGSGGNAAGVSEGFEGALRARASPEGMPRGTCLCASAGSGRSWGRLACWSDLEDAGAVDGDELAHAAGDLRCGRRGGGTSVEHVGCGGRGLAGSGEGRLNSALDLAAGGEDGGDGRGERRQLLVGGVGLDEGCGGEENVGGH